MIKKLQLWQIKHLFSCACLTSLVTSMVQSNMDNGYVALHIEILQIILIHCLKSKKSSIFLVTQTWGLYIPSLTRYRSEFTILCWLWLCHSVITNINRFLLLYYCNQDAEMIFQRFLNFLNNCHSLFIFTLACIATQLILNFDIYLLNIDISHSFSSSLTLV